MSRSIKIFDTTLRDGEQSPGCSMNLKEKIEVAKQLDTAYQQPMGQSLLEIRQLLAQRCFLFDILTPVTKLKAGDLQLENIEAMSGALRVSNQ